jgi:hypothetical protein
LQCKQLAGAKIVKTYANEKSTSMEMRKKENERDNEIDDSSDGGSEDSVGDMVHSYGVG